MTEVEQVFYNRGIEPQNLKHYLYTTADDLLDPAEIANIETGAKMLIKHIANGDKIFVQVDSDCDGFTSSALLLNYLNRLFPAAVQHNFDYRLHTGKEHGLILETIPKDAKLVIAPDSSSNDFDIHEILADRGVDVLVIDHHLADYVSEYACIINNQMCDYPTKSLSGVGMVYKFCSYIDSLLNKNIADDYLDLAALGIIADVMELKDFETRYIVEQGMKNVRNPFIAAMVDRQSFKLSKGLTPIGVAFYIAPYVNAINRSGDIDERLLLFESMLEYRAYEQIPSTKRGCRGQMETRVEQAVRTCNNVKNRQGKARDDLTDMAEQQIKENGLLSDVVIIIKIPKTQVINKNLTGLIATQIANKYRHPTLVLNETAHDGEKWWEGSGRGAPHIPIINTRQTLLDTGCVEYVEG